MKTGKFLYTISPQDSICGYLYYLSMENWKINRCWGDLKNQMRYGFFYNWENWIEERIKHELAKKRNR